MFICAKKVTLQQAEELVRLENYAATNREINDQYKYMSDFKDRVAAWGRDRVRKLQFEEAIQLEMNFQEWTDIQNNLPRTIQEK